MNPFSRSTYRIAIAAVVATTAASGAAWAKAKVDPQAILSAKCAGCHERTADGGLARISEQRKTPEGWLMTVKRMASWHGVHLGEGEEKVLVKHLSDTLGLAPAEAAPFRYALERRPGTVETPDDAELNTFCGRCHTYARVGLQRRDKHEWTKLVHMHLGQWPTLEYQANSRDRQWWTLASTDIAAKLGAKWPMQTAAWSEWRQRKSADLSGSWRLGGERPGKGAYDGRMTAKRVARDEYSLTVDLTYADGSKESGKGTAIVYTGHEWRGTLDMGKRKVRQVFSVQPGGAAVNGRWFLDDDTALGGDLRAVRDGAGAVVSVQPAYLKAGATTTVTILGTGLAGDVSLGAGIKVLKTVSASPDRIVVEAEAATNAPLGLSSLKVGTLDCDVGVVVYDMIASVRVEPAFDIARTGGAGGPIAPERTQFQAVGYMHGPDGKPGTADDVRIGVMPAAWSLDNYNHEAVQAKDVEFGGKIDKAGLFTPAPAGQNPARGGLNNYADLAVKAKVKDGAAEVEGRGHLIVAPQRWNNPPIL